MKIFFVAVSCEPEAYSLAKRLIADCGATDYASAEEFFPEGVQDPCRAVDETDAVFWVTGPAQIPGLSLTDYNHLYSDSVFLRAVNSGKPVIYYYCRGEGTDDSRPFPAALKLCTRRHVVSALIELERLMQRDLQDLMAGAIPSASRPSVFLSHTKADKPFARQLGDDLRKAGARIWIDEAEIRVGDSLIAKIREGIDHMDYFAVILSPESVTSEWVKHEVDVAMNQEVESRRVKVLPLLYRSCELPGFLKGKLYADFSSDYTRGLEQVLRRLELHQKSQ